MQVGDKVNWDKQERAGYGRFHAIAGVVSNINGSCITLAVYQPALGKVIHKYAKASNLSPRTNHCELDEAYAAQKERKPA